MNSVKFNGSINSFPIRSCSTLKKDFHQRKHICFIEAHKSWYVFCDSALSYKIIFKV